MSHDPISLIRKLLPFTSAALIFASLYVGWIFYSRWQAGRDAERRQAEARIAEAQKVLDAYGGNKVTVLSFSADRGAIRRGETAQICYGVSNAKTVKIEPAVGDTWPSMYRCLDITPTKDTTYTLTAEDGHGHSETRSIQINVMK